MRYGTTLLEQLVCFLPPHSTWTLQTSEIDVSLIVIVDTTRTDTHKTFHPLHNDHFLWVPRPFLNVYPRISASEKTVDVWKKIPDLNERRNTERHVSTGGDDSVPNCLRCRYYWRERRLERCDYESGNGLSYEWSQKSVKQ